MQPGDLLIKQRKFVLQQGAGRRGAVVFQIPRDDLNRQIERAQVADDVEPPDFPHTVGAVAVFKPLGVQKALFLIIPQKIRADAVELRELADFVIAFHREVLS